MFEIKHKSEETVHFYLAFFEGFNAFLMKNAMFCFYKFHFLLAIVDMLEQNHLDIPDLDYSVGNITRPPPTTLILSGQVLVASTYH